MRRLLAPFVAALVLASVVPASASPALIAEPKTTGACGGALVYLYTLHIEAEPRKKTYARGETIEIDVTVTRPAEHDPAGNGVPMDRPYVEPAADVEVGVAVWVRNTYRWDISVTDDEGKALLRVRMPPDSDTGWARAEFVAEKEHYSNNGCPDVRELEYRSYDRFVKVVP